MDHPKPHGAGKSSFDLLDFPDLVQHLDLKPGMCVLDLGCGKGNYALALAALPGLDLKITGLDLWAEGIETLNRTALSLGLEKNVRGVVAQAGKKLPLVRQAFDLVLMATVFHDFVREGVHFSVLDELDRVLDPQGRVAVVEFKKIPGPPGPPMEIRLSAHELADFFTEAGFRETANAVISPSLYLSLFAR